MLVLSRKLGEKIVLGDNIVVTVVKIDGGQVRLGLEAPKDVTVYRKELEGPNGERPAPHPKTEEGGVARLRQRMSNR